MITKLKSILIICLYLLVFSASKIYSLPPFETKNAKTKIDLMLASEEFKDKYKIVKISKPCNNICIVAIKPPYREFPNIIIFKYDSKTDDYIRIYEGLCFGIQDKPSDKLDFHTTGDAADFTIGNDTNNPGGKITGETKKVINASNQTGSVCIPYQEFYHMHSSSATESYTIDKTNYYDLAVKLIDRYEGYPRKTCVMYDMPNLIDIQFTYDGKEYCVTGITDNKQKWEISFDDIYQDNKYLLNKALKAKKNLK